MKLAFNGEARYPDYQSGYDLYVHRSRSRECVDLNTYKKVIKRYCQILADRLEKKGIVDIPELGSVSAAVMYRKAQYRGNQFIGYGKMNWKDHQYDGEPRAFGIVFLPDRRKSENLRSFGFVANRKLFKRIQQVYQSDYCPWVPIEFSEDIV